MGIVDQKFGLEYLPGKWVVHRIKIPPGIFHPLFHIFSSNCHAERSEASGWRGFGISGYWPDSSLRSSMKAIFQTDALPEYAGRLMDASPSMARALVPVFQITEHEFPPGTRPDTALKCDTHRSGKAFIAPLPRHDRASSQYSPGEEWDRDEFPLTEPSIPVTFIISTQIL